MPRIFTIAAFVLLATGCATEKAYESWEYSRVQDCKLRYSPNDPQLEHCLEQARMPYDDYEQQRTESKTGADNKPE